MTVTEIVVELSEDEFSVCYPLVPNHINPTTGWVAGDGCGRLFETGGDEFEYVRRQNPRCVWTWVDQGEDDTYVVSGLHTANRLGYLVSDTPVSDGYCIQVRLRSRDDNRVP